MARRRLAFAKQHVRKSAAQRNDFLQAVGDIKEFTFYPSELRPKFKQLTSPWTYMRAEERYKPAFVRPKRWFKRNDYKRVLKQKVFGMTTSAGKMLGRVVAEAFHSRQVGHHLENKSASVPAQAVPKEAAISHLVGRRGGLARRGCRDNDGG